MTAFLAHETKPRRSKRRIRLSKFALRLLPSSQLGIELRPVFLKLSMTADPPNYERRRNPQDWRNQPPRSVPPIVRA